MSVLENKKEIKNKQLKRLSNRHFKPFSLSLICRTPRLEFGKLVNKTCLNIVLLDRHVKLGSKLALEQKKERTEHKTTRLQIDFFISKLGGKEKNYKDFLFLKK